MSTLSSEPCEGGGAGTACDVTAWGGGCDNEGGGGGGGRGKGTAVAWDGPELVTCSTVEGDSWERGPVDMMEELLLERLSWELRAWGLACC